MMTTFRTGLALGLVALSVSLARAGDGVPVAPVGPGEGCCTTCTGPYNCRDSGWTPCQRKIYDWLTYQPLQRPGPCDCARRRECCPPPLYVFFLYPGCAGGGTCGCGHAGFVPAAYGNTCCPTCPH